MFMQNIGLKLHNKLAKMRYNNMPFWPLVTPHRTNRSPVENSIMKFAICMPFGPPFRLVFMIHPQPSPIPLSAGTFSTGQCPLTLI